MTRSAARVTLLAVFSADTACLIYVENLGELYGTKGLPWQMGSSGRLRLHAFLVLAMRSPMLVTGVIPMTTLLNAASAHSGS